MGEYWSVDEARWVRYTPDPDVEDVVVPEPRAEEEPAQTTG